MPQLCHLLLFLVASKAFRSTCPFSIYQYGVFLHAPHCRTGHRFQVLKQPLHGCLASLNSSARCLYAWWRWCYSLMLLLQSHLLLLLLIFSITFTFLALMEYLSRTYCHRKKAVYFSELLIEHSGVAFNFCGIY